MICSVCADKGVTKKMRVYNKECDCGICGICTGAEEIHEQDKIKTEEVIWQKHKIQEVLDYFVKDFNLPSGTKILNSESFFDAQKGEVVFRLILGRR